MSPWYASAFYSAGCANVITTPPVPMPVANFLAKYGNDLSTSPLSTSGGSWPGAYISAGEQSMGIGGGGGWVPDCEPTPSINGPVPGSHGMYRLGALGVDARSTSVNCAFPKHFSPTCSRSLGLPSTFPMTAGGYRSAPLAPAEFSVSSAMGTPI